MKARLGEQREYVEELHDAARPAVRKDERESVGARRARVHEVDAQAVDRGGELGHGVEAPLRRAPDLSEIRALTGYAPTVGLEEGVRRTYAWYRDNVFSSDDVPLAPLGSPRRER